MLQPREFKELRRPDGYPRKLTTIGDHIRATRLDRKLTQEQAATAIGVDAFSLLGWEKNQHQPTASTYRKIIIFLGYNPIDDPAESRTFGERLVFTRLARGLTQRDAAALIGIDPGTLSRYERDVKMPERGLSSRIERFLNKAI